MCTLVLFDSSGKKKVKTNKQTNKHNPCKKHTGLIQEAYVTMFFTAIYFHFITRDPSIIHYPGTYQIIQKQGILFFLLNKTLVFPLKRKERKKKNFTKIQGPVGVWVQWNGDFVERKKEKKKMKEIVFFFFFGLSIFD